MSFKWRDGAGTYHELTGLKTFPRKGIPPDWTLVMESAKVSINDTVQHHTESCPKGKPEKCVISIDGVSESKSGGSSAEIVSFSFQGCRHVYPVYMCRKSEKGQIVDYNILIGKHVLDMQSVGVAVEMVVADSVAVAKLLCMRSHAAFYSCRYCKREGNSFAQTQGRKKPSPLAARRQTKKVTWSYTPREFPLRTEERIAACAVYAMGNLRTQCKKKLAKGIMGRCMLLENANFDVTVGVPCEYMHLVYSGKIYTSLHMHACVSLTHIYTTVYRFICENHAINIRLWSKISRTHKETCSTCYVERKVASIEDAV